MPDEPVPDERAPDGDTLLAEPEEVRLVRAEVESAAAERLTFFSDAVIAIAITLLALELPVPDGNTATEVLHSLREHRADYVAFFISFAVIGAHWTSHHAVFRWVRRLGGHVRRLNLLWLMIMVLMPFVTKVLTESDEGSGFVVRFGLYAVAQVAAAVLFVLMLRAMRRYDLFRPGVPARVVDSGLIRSATMIVMFGVSIPIAFTGEWAYLAWIATPLATWFVRFALRRPSTRRPSSPTRSGTVM